MKKHWIYIKRGLSEDPKHREAMGECVWLYMHIIDRADWETGIAYGWKDEQEAADMGMNVRTLREQRRKLDELDYITCKQKQYSQDIVIKRWIDPRNYSGQVLNQGDVEMEPQDDTQDYTHGSSQDVTPTLDSKLNSNSLSEKDYQQVNAKVDAMIANSGRADWQGRETFRPDHYPLVDWYHRVTGQDCPKSKQKDWHKAVMMWASNGLTVDDLQAAYDMDIKWRGVFTSPNQLTDKAIALRAQKQTAPQDERPLPPPVPERIGVPNPFKKPENIK